MPTPKVEWLRAERRSSNTLGMEMVAALKMTPPQAVATVRTANTRAGAARDKRGERDADVAEDPVHPEDPAHVLPVCDEHGDADRVVDRCEDADQREAQGDLHGPRGEAGEDARRADAEEEHPHHALPAPAVGEPPCRDREGAEGDKAPERERQKIPVAAAGLGTHREHHGGENEHEEMSERVPDIEEQAHAARGVHGEEMITGQVYLRLRRSR